MIKLQTLDRTFLDVLATKNVSLVVSSHRGTLDQWIDSFNRKHQKEIEYFMSKSAAKVKNGGIVRFHSGPIDNLRGIEVEAVYIIDSTVSHNDMMYLTSRVRL